MTDPVRLATVLLVDRRGWLLLQERDELAPRSADQWGMVGGHVEEGEDFEAAACRELEEETGIVLPAAALTLWQDARYTYPDGYRGHYRVYAARVPHTDADIVVGEGRQIVFVDPDRIEELDLSGSAGHFLGPFLASELYQSLREETG